VRSSAAAIIVFLFACGEELEPTPGTFYAFPNRVTLVGPGDSRVITILAQDASGRLAEVALAARVEDEAIASWSGDRVVARAAGRTGLTFDSGGASARVEIEIGDRSPFAAELIEWRRGDGAGFGAERMPGVVLGPPMGGGEYAGSTDVASLGVGGSITLGFGGLGAFDGPGPDLIVFENAFRVAGGAMTFAEPAAIEVALGEGPWTALPCSAEPPYRGCAGVAPVLAGAQHAEIDPRDPDRAGGDAFDLPPIIDRVRITDLGAGEVTGDNSGFDLDAVAVVHPAPANLSGIELDPRSLTMPKGTMAILPRVDGVLPTDERLFGLRAIVASPEGEVITVEGPLIHAAKTGTAAIVFSFGPFEAELLVEVTP
jgi:hypothetical protein